MKERDIDKIRDSRLRNALQKYFEYMRMSRSVHTIRAYEHDIFAALDETTTWECVNAPTKTFWRQYLNKRQSEGLKSNARVVSAWKAFFTFCAKQGYEVKSGALRLPSVTPPRRIFDIPAEDSMKTALSQHVSSWIAQRNIALFVLMYCTGLRISEALSIKNWAASSDMLRVVGKGNKTRDVPVLKVVNAVISRYREMCPHDTSQYLFVSNEGTRLSYHTVYQATRRMYACVCWGSGTHNLRRAAATHLLRAGMDVESVRLLLGHANLNTTQRYIVNDYAYLKNKYHKARKLVAKEGIEPSTHGL